MRVVINVATPCVPWSWHMCPNRLGGLCGKEYLTTFQESLQSEPVSHPCWCVHSLRFFVSIPTNLCTYFHWPINRRIPICVPDAIHSQTRRYHITRWITISNGLDSLSITAQHVRYKQCSAKSSKSSKTLALLPTPSYLLSTKLGPKLNQS